MLTCKANRLPPVDPEVGVKSWLLECFKRILSYEACGEPASHLAYGDLPMCPAHAEQVMATLREANCVANVHLGRGRTEGEIAEMVRPIGENV